MKTIIILLNLVLLNHCAAVTVRFDDADRAPSDSLQFGNITITGNGFQVSTVAGVGLGLSGFGSNGDVVRSFHYLPGASLADVIGDEHITFSGGGVTSLIIKSVWRNFDQPFSILVSSSEGILGEGDIHHDDPWDFVGLFSDPQPTISAYTSGIWWSETPFDGTRGGDLSEELTIQFGFSVLSMEYAAVPEPSTLALLSVGGLAWLVGRRIKP